VLVFDGFFSINKIDYVENRTTWAFERVNLDLRRLLQVMRSQEINLAPSPERTHTTTFSYYRFDFSITRIHAHSKSTMPSSSISSSYQQQRSETTSLLLAARRQQPETPATTNRPRSDRAVLGITMVLTLSSIVVVLVMGAMVISLRQKSSSKLLGDDHYDAGLSSVEALSMNIVQGKSSPSVCDDGQYPKRALKLAYELTFPALFPDTKGMTKFEASSVIFLEDSVYSVCDSSWSIFKFDAQLQPFLPTNVLIGDPQREPEDSGYEALFHANGTLYLVRESVEHDEGEYHAIIEEIDVVESDDDYKVTNVCSTEFEFEGSSKGFEGAVPVLDLNGQLVVLGLCEGNHCSESHKKKIDRGNGRVVAMRKEILSDGTTTCQWSTIRQFKVPSSAAFLDYSAISVDSSGRVAISSQEDSMLWVGQLLGQNDEGLWDVDVMEFDPAVGDVYMFPKNDNCETVYCNIEGVSWLDAHTIIAVSDKMKGNGRQDFRCFSKDQSVHVFKLP
jgi:hypothetical protein